MIPDATTISDALHDATAALFTDTELGARARYGGRRRLRHRRISAAAALLAALTVAVPLAIALTPTGNRSTLNVGSSGSSGSGMTLHSAPTTPRSTGTLYATPPPAGATCYIGGDTSPTVETAYPQLLMLPADEPVSSAFTNVYPFAEADSPGCEPAHVALTLLKTDGNTVTQGILVQGPDAPTPSNSFPGGANADCGCRRDHPEVQGEPAIAWAEPTEHDNKTDVFWSDPSGAQWRAQSVGIGEAALVDVLNRLQLDADAGTANLPNATLDGWTVEPLTPDAQGPTAVFYATCAEVDLIVSQGPDRTYQDAASMPGRQLVTIQGHPANLVADNGTPSIAWHASDDVTVQVSAISPMPITRLEQIASTVNPVNPSDPRLATR